MAAYNAGEYIAETMESVLSQSFPDFEFVIVDNGSTDNTLSIIRSFKDRRIRIIENSHDFIGSLNMGMDTAQGKYIARMDADDIMHVDRLKIQRAIMEEEPGITICSSWMSPFGKEIPKGAVPRTISGILKSPLLHLLKNNPIVNSTSIMRRDFIKKHALQYEYYEHAEDYKWWVEMAKSGAVFYIEPQPLVYCRISEIQEDHVCKEKMSDSSINIKKEIVDYLVMINKERFPGLADAVRAIYNLKANELMADNDILSFFYFLFEKNKYTLVTGIDNKIGNN